MRKAPAAVNLRLPAVAVQGKNIRGHSGSHSYTTGSVSAGTSDTVTAAATKHKSMDSLKRYHHADEGNSVLPAINIARKEAKRRRVVEDETSEDGRGGFKISGTIFSTDDDSGEDKDEDDRE